MKKLFTLLALVVLSMAVHAQKYHNDVNKDGMVNVSDVTCQVNKMLGAPNLGEASYPDANRPFLLNYPNFRQKKLAVSPKTITFAAELKNMY